MEEIISYSPNLHIDCIYVEAIWIVKCTNGI